MEKKHKTKILRRQYYLISYMNAQILTLQKGIDMAFYILQGFYYHGIVIMILNITSLI